MLPHCRRLLMVASRTARYLISNTSVYSPNKKRCPSWEYLKQEFRPCSRRFHT